MDEDKGQRWDALASHAEAAAAKWAEAATLLRALRDDPGAEAVAELFGFNSDTRIYVSGARPGAAEACAALGRAIRSIIAGGGADITDPGGLLSRLTSGHRPSFQEVPFFKNGEPVPRAVAA